MLPLKNRLIFKPDATLFTSAKTDMMYLPFRATNFFLKLSIIGIVLLMSLISCKKDDESHPKPTPGVTAHAGTDLTLSVGQTANLDGSTSKDSEGKALTFNWIFTQKPEGSAAILTNATQAKPTFVIDVAGIYEIELTVTSTSGQAKDKVIVTATTGNTTQTISSHITADRLLKNIISDPAIADYRVTSAIEVSAKLTIEPGVIIEFEADKGLAILSNGSLLAKGTAHSPIIFTGKNKSKGFWKGIVIYSNSPLNELEHVIIEHGGSSNIPGIPLELKANIALLGATASSSTLKVSHTTISNSGGLGMYVSNQSELAAFSSNTFLQNTASALYVPARQVHKLDAISHFSGSNGYNGVQIGGNVQENSQVTWPLLADGASYYVITDIDIESGLTLSEGIHIEFNPRIIMRVKGQGYLSASGSTNKPIILTSFLKTEQEYWGGLLFESASLQNKLAYAEISYAGNKGLAGFGDTRANVSVAASGRLSIEHTMIKHSLGWGIAALRDLGSVLNSDAATANTFESVYKGKVKWNSVDLTTTLEGDWLDSWTFNRMYPIGDNYYNPQTGIWFNGALTPWNIQPASGFGLRIAENGSFTWTIAEYGSWSGCGNPYSAEYITGQVSKQEDKLTFGQNYWRSKFYHPCDESQNVDTTVEPVSVELRYEIYREQDTTGEQYWVLKLINPDNSFFTYYRR